MRESAIQKLVLYYGFGATYIVHHDDYNMTKMIVALIVLIVVLIVALIVQKRIVSQGCDTKSEIGNHK